MKSHFATTILVLASLLGGSANAQLLHRYDFSSGANDTVGTANGTLEGGSTITGGALVTSNQVSGQWSGGAPLAGLMLPSSAVAGITGPFTIETWFQAASQSDWPKFQTTFSFSDGTEANYVLATPVRGYSPWPSSVAVIGGGGNANEQLVQGIYLDTPLVHQQLVTFDGARLTYYIDGALASFSGLSATASDPGLNLSTLTDIGIGGGSPWPDNALHGQTFDFRIYGQALTAAQVAAVYALGSDASNSSISNAIAPPTSLPVYRIVGLGPTAAQAAALAQQLNIPSSLISYTNGLVTFIDPTNFMFVPSKPVTDPVVVSNLLSVTKNPSTNPIVIQALDFAALTNLSATSTNFALASASNALAATGLTPQFGTALLIAHTLFTAFMTNADQTVSSAHQDLDTQVNYLLTDTNGIPLLGPGSQVQLTYGLNSNVTRLLYACPQLAPAQSVKIISPADATNRVAQFYPPGAQLSPMLCYWDDPWWWWWWWWFHHDSIGPPGPIGDPVYVVPYYLIYATMNVTNPVTGTSYMASLAVQAIPATDDTNFVPSVILSVSGTNPVVASAAVTGGLPPYTYVWGTSDPAAGTNGDSFVSYTPKIKVSQPSLAVAYDPINSSVSVLWPYPSTGFVLQSTHSLTPSAWFDIPGPYQYDTNNGVYVVTVPGTNTAFFRLHLASQTLPVTETVSLTVIDADGVAIQTNIMVQTVATPVAAKISVAKQLDDPPTWGTESPYYGHWIDNLTPWLNVMRTPGLGAGQEVFCWPGYSAWPGDFAEPTPARGLQPIHAAAPWSAAPVIYADADYDHWGVDTANLVLYSGHGNSSAFSFTLPDYTPMDGSPAYGVYLDFPGHGMAAHYIKGSYRYPLDMTRAWASVGVNQYLFWLGFSSCEVLMYNAGHPTDTSAPTATGGPYAWQRWGGAFNGLHIMFGYHTAMCYTPPHSGTPALFANNMLGAAGPAMSIVQAWRNSSDTTQPQVTWYSYNPDTHLYESNPPVEWAAMGPLGPGTAFNYFDCYPGKGNVSASIPAGSIQGWWYANTHHVWPPVFVH